MNRNINEKSARGPLAGLRVLEFAALGPAPMACMILADWGAEVINVVRSQNADSLFDAKFNILGRGKHSLPLNLKSAEDVAVAKSLMTRADIVVEGFRPGVMEKLGLSPEVALAQNPALVYGRLTGWGQQGPMAQKAGHDINFLALTGVLAALGREGEAPTIPLNMVADAGGSLTLVMGLLAALTSARSTGRGQVVDCAMVDAVPLMASMVYMVAASGQLSAPRGGNWLDGGAHFYNTYACADGKRMAVGSIEPNFYQALLKGCGINLEQEPDFAKQWQQDLWPSLKNKLSQIFICKSQAEWTSIFTTLDACVTPVETFESAPHHPHYQARASFFAQQGITQSSPAPLFSQTPSPSPTPERPIDRALLARWQLDESSINRLIA